MAPRLRNLWTAAGGGAPDGRAGLSTPSRWLPGRRMDMGATLGVGRVAPASRGQVGRTSDPSAVYNGTAA